jgi:hypothetical protein
MWILFIILIQQLNMVLVESKLKPPISPQTKDL